MKRKRRAKLLINAIALPFTVTLCLFFANVLTGGKYGWLIYINAVLLGISVLWFASFVIVGISTTKQMERAYQKHKFTEFFDDGDYINGNLELVKGGDRNENYDQRGYCIPRVQGHKVQSNDGRCGSRFNA